jgi:hypothetical protein
MELMQRVESSLGTRKRPMSDIEILRQSAVIWCAMLKRVFLSLLAWQLCLAGAVLVTLAFGGGIDKSVIVPCVAAGFVVALAVTLVAQRVEKGRAAMMGFGVGLLPTIAGITYGWYLAHRPVDASAGWLAFNLWLSLPSAVGGVLSGFISASRRVDPSQVL